MIKNQIIKLTFFLTLLISISTAQDLKLPDLGTPSDSILSPVKEKEIRDEIVKQIYEYDLVITDPFIASYMEDLGYRIASKSSKPSFSFDFFIVNQDIVNASAYPGGLIVFFSGLFLKTDTESELASVMAHEVAHATQRHISRAYAKNSKNILPTILGLVGAAVAAQSSSSGDAPIAIATATMAMQQQAMINFTRENEYEADRVGINTLANAGFNTEGMADFFSKLMENRPIDPRYQSNEYQRTHPLSINRVTEAKNRSKLLKPDIIKESSEYPYIKERLRVLTQKNELDHINYYKKLFQELPDTEITEAQKYGYALSYFKSNQPKNSLKMIENITTSSSNKMILGVLKANSTMLINEESGLKQFNQLRAFYPENPKIIIPYIEALSRTKNFEHLNKARALAKQLTQIAPENPNYFQILAVINQNGNRTIEASEALAMKEHLISNNYRAVRILKNLLKSDLSYFQHARIEAKIIEFETLITNEERQNERLADRIGKME